jgi:hypothetical protein
LIPSTGTVYTGPSNTPAPGSLLFGTSRGTGRADAIAARTNTAIATPTLRLVGEMPEEGAFGDPGSLGDLRQGCGVGYRLGPLD